MLRHFLLPALSVAAVFFTGCDLRAVSDRTAKAGEEPAPKAKKKHKENRLAKETSPYLLLHKNNPVDWYPWSPEAFAKAKKEGKPIFLSIGYSSCYWCHVMERKVFENEKIAAYMNKHFINIKVDREERPDVDDIYMNSLHVFFQMIGSKQGGGWPLSMFLTPEGKPFLGGTYFPPEKDPKSGRAGFGDVAQLVAKIWKERRKDVENNANVITRAVQRMTKPGLSLEKVDVDNKLVEASAKELIDTFDEQYGGIGFNKLRPNAPKFPTPAKLNLLAFQIRHAKDRDAAKVIEKTLDEIARGGIRDHLAGGFHRYSTDRKWHVPHFEKMLYDQSQLALLYLEAWRQSKKPLYREIAEEILDFVLAEMTDAKGGFHSALDAETDGIEGKHYVWSKEELEKILGKRDAQVFFEVYGLNKENPFEHGFVLHLSESTTATAKKKGFEPSAFRDRLAEMRRDVLRARKKRKKLLQDDKVLTGWNGLMIQAFAEAGAEFKTTRYTDAAEKAATFILSNMRDKKGRLLRTWRKGQAKLNAYQSDYAYLISGLLALEQATGEKKWLNASQRLTDDMLDLFWDKAEGAFFFTMKDHETLIAKIKNGYDAVQPSGNSVAVRVLIRLAKRTGKEKYLSHADEVLKVFAPVLKRTPRGCPNMAIAVAEFLAAKKSGVSEPKPMDPPKVDPPKKEPDPKPKKEQLVTGTAFFNVRQLPAGGTAKVLVVLKIKKGWHIYANKVGNEINGPTVFKIKSQLGTKLTKVLYPKGKQATYDLGDGDIIQANEYKSEVALWGTVTVPESAGGKTERLALTVEFQACNDITMVCRMPKPITLNGTIDVVAKGKPVEKANSKHFKHWGEPKLPAKPK